MGGWRLCSKDRIHTNWQIEPTSKYLQEQELPKQSRSNSGQFQMSRLVHRNHSARKTRTNRKLVLRQSSAVGHSTLQLQDSCSSEQEKTKNHTVQGAGCISKSPMTWSKFVKSRFRMTYSRDLVTHFNPSGPRSRNKSTDLNWWPTEMDTSQPFQCFQSLKSLKSFFNRFFIWKLPEIPGYASASPLEGISPRLHE